jgi:hypothetical protein
MFGCDAKVIWLNRIVSAKASDPIQCFIPIISRANVCNVVCNQFRVSYEFNSSGLRHKPQPIAWGPPAKPKTRISLYYAGSSQPLRRSRDSILFPSSQLVNRSVSGSHFSSSPTLFAHSFLASLSRTYLGFHHEHQKLGLLVLIQFVLQIVIHLASAVQREKLRSSLDDVGRRPKVQNLFIGGAGTKQLSDLFKDFQCGFSCRHAGPGLESLWTLFRASGSSQLGPLLSGSTFRVDIKRFHYTGRGQMIRAQLNGQFPARVIWPQSPVSVPLLTRRSGSLRSSSVGRKQSAL